MALFVHFMMWFGKLKKGGSEFLDMFFKDLSIGTKNYINVSIHFSQNEENILTQFKAISHGSYRKNIM